MSLASHMIKVNNVQHRQVSQISSSVVLVNSSTCYISKFFSLLYFVLCRLLFLWTVRNLGRQLRGHQLQFSCQVVIPNSHQFNNPAVVGTDPFFLSALRPHRSTGSFRYRGFVPNMTCNKVWEDQCEWLHLHMKSPWLPRMTSTNLKGTNHSAPREDSVTSATTLCRR